MAAPRSALSARISAVRSVTTVPAALTSSSWSPGCLPRTCHAPIGGGTAAGGPFGQRLGPPKVMDRSQGGRVHGCATGILSGGRFQREPLTSVLGRLQPEVQRCV